MDTTEARDLVAAWLLLSVAFANLLGGLRPAAIVVAGTTVGVGFVLHELAHRAVARRFGLGARFEADYRMLAFAVLLSFAGLVFAAPGAVVTRGQRTRRQQLFISVSGPVTNIVLALGFLAVPGLIGLYGFRINAWLALFNMIPVGGLDGQAVLRADRRVYLGVVAAAAVLVFGV